jgi:hypothetical protein
MAFLERPSHVIMSPEPGKRDAQEWVNKGSIEYYDPVVLVAQLHGKAYGEFDQLRGVKYLKTVGRLFDSPQTSVVRLVSTTDETVVFEETYTPQSMNYFV